MAARAVFSDDRAKASGWAGGLAAQRVMDAPGCRTRARNPAASQEAAKASGSWAMGGKVLKCMGDGQLGADHLHGPEGVRRAHGEEVSDGKQGRIQGLVRQQGHIRHQGGVTGVVDPPAAHFKDEAGGETAGHAAAVDGLKDLGRSRRAWSWCRPDSRPGSGRRRAQRPPPQDPRVQQTAAPVRLAISTASPTWSPWPWVTKMKSGRMVLASSVWPVPERKGSVRTLYLPSSSRKQAWPRNCSSIVIHSFSVIRRGAGGQRVRRGGQISMSAGLPPGGGALRGMHSVQHYKTRIPDFWQIHNPVIGTFFRPDVRRRLLDPGERLRPCAQKRPFPAYAGTGVGSGQFLTAA